MDFQYVNPSPANMMAKQRKRPPMQWAMSTVRSMMGMVASFDGGGKRKVGMRRDRAGEKPC